MQNHGYSEDDNVESYWQVFIFTENIQGLSSIDAVIQSVKAMLQSVWSDKLIVVISPLTVL